MPITVVRDMSFKIMLQLWSSSRGYKTHVSIQNIKQQGNSSKRNDAANVYGSYDGHQVASNEQVHQYSEQP